MRWFWALLTFFSLTLSASASPKIGIWKYFGRDYNTVSFRQLHYMFYEFSGTAAVKFNREGSFLRTPFVPNRSLGDGWTDYTFMDDNPVRQEILAQRDRLRKNEELNECTLLVINQQFSLSMMINLGNFSQVYGDQVMKVILYLLPEQITTVETMRTWSETMLKRQYGGVPEFARLNPDEDEGWLNDQNNRRNWHIYYNAFMRDGPTEVTEESLLERRKEKIQEAYFNRRARRNYYDVKTSSAWLISGQTPSGQHPIALELKEDGTRGTTIDRKKYPYIWEDGRLASNVKGDHYYSLLALTEQAEHEAALLGLPLDQCYFMMHVNIKKLQEHYAEDLGLFYVGPHHDGGDHVIMGAKLLDFKNTLIHKTNAIEEMINLQKPEKSITLKPTLANAVIYEFPDLGVYIRDFSKLPHDESVSPPLSFLEVIASEKGARDMGGRMGQSDQMSRYDQLGFRMMQYYGQDSWAPFQERKPDHKYFMRSRFYDLEAIVVDRISNIFTIDLPWEAPLVAAFEFAAAKIKTSGGHYHPQHFVIPIRGYISDPLKALMNQLGGKIENIYWDPVIQHGIRNSFLALPPATGGDSMNMVVLPYDEVEKYVHALPGTFREQMKNYLKSRSLADQYWDYPLFGY